MKLTYNDAAHTYTLDGKRCKSVTAVAKIPDDTYALDNWRKRQVLLGVALQPALVERAAAHHDDKDQLNRIAEEALTAAKSHEAAARGTAAHRIAERVDLDELIIDTPQAQVVRAAWDRALQIAGLEIVPDFVERIVVYPDQRIAGRFDRFARRKADKRLVVVDLKTGTNAVKYPHSMAVQLALYANAPLMAGPIPRDGGSTDQFHRLPDNLDRTVGYVIHMPADGQVDVVAIDLNKGWDAAQLCFQVLDWRARKDLVIPVAEVLLEAPQRTEWIRERLAEIASHGPQARDLTAWAWPETVPARPPWTDQQIDTLDLALQLVETRVEATFEPSDPSIHTTKQPRKAS
jgi:hypothetical protein